MKKEGQITIFLSMILLCVSSLMCALVETARMAGARCYLQTVANSSIDSLFSEYHREIWDRYRLLLLEADSKNVLEKEFEKYSGRYFETPGWYPMQLKEVNVAQWKRVTEDKGAYLEQEILDYMKYGVWENLDLDTNQAEDIFRGVKEACAVHEITNSYQFNSREALKLEEALEAIRKVLDKQNAVYKEAETRLEMEDGSGFRVQGRILTEELNKIPGLVSHYEKIADQLLDKMNAAETKLEDKSEDLSDSVKVNFNQEMNHYKAYLERDGERRKEIVKLIEISKQNQQLTKQTMEKSIEVEEYIEEWEAAHDGDDEEEELDTAELWRPVQRDFQTYHQTALSFQTGVKDKESQKLLEGICDMADNGLLSLVLPEGTELSQVVKSMSGIPSANGSAELNETEADRGNLVTRIMTNEYCLKFFTDFCNEGKQTAGKDQLQYEAEYLLSGKAEDKSNLQNVVQQLLGIRIGFNLVHILSDAGKCEEARNLAMAITGATGLLPLAGIMTFFIITVWALGESIMDLNLLLMGKKVPVLKNRETWRTSLSGLMEFARNKKIMEDSEKQSESQGLLYSGYLKLLLMMEDSGQKYIRAMDLIQWNQEQIQPGFRIEDCVYSACLEGTVYGQHLFFCIGFMENNNKLQKQYEINFYTEKTY